MTMMMGRALTDLLPSINSVTGNENPRLRSFADSHRIGRGTRPDRGKGSIVGIAETGTGEERANRRSQIEILVIRTALQCSTVCHAGAHREEEPPLADRHEPVLLKNSANLRARKGSKPTQPEPLPA